MIGSGVAELDALAELAGLCESHGDPAEAIVHAERLLHDDPVRERTYRTLMRLHDGQGDRARAVRIFHLCSTTLERELGVEPSDATRLTYEALLDRDTDSTSTTHTGRPPLVGRAPERARLAAAWRSADAGAARFVLVSGEPGVGKSRLVEEFRAWCARGGATAADARCYPAEGSLAYGPSWTGCGRPRCGPGCCGSTGPGSPRSPGCSPSCSSRCPSWTGRPPCRRTTSGSLFDAVSTAVLTPGGPVLLVVDDLQHGGRETCQLLHYLLRIAPGARVLVVATVRPEELDVHHPVHDLVAGLRSRDRLDEIELHALTPRETAHLAERLTGRSFAEPEAQRLYDETEGNPLYVVEAVRAGWAPGRPLSPRVQSVIEDRLAQLSDPARELVGVAATIGREFSTDVLARVTGSDEDALVGGLDELWRRGLVREQGLGRYGAGYDFSHDKIRQVAYLDVTPARRRRLHRLVAAALEQANADAPEPVSAQIAAHHEHAGALQEAVTWYRRAAEAAQVLHAGGVAVGLLERALELLETLPGSAGRDAMELELCTALLGPLVPLHGYASAALSATQQRALRLADGLGVEAAAPLLRSLALRALTRDDLAGATRYGQLLQAAGEREGDDVLVVEGAYVLGIASFWQADLAPARQAFELAVERYRPADRSVHLLRYAQDPKVVCLSRLGNTLWFLGLPDAAVQARTAALAWADEIDHPFSRSVAVVFGAVLALDMGDEQSLRQYAAEMRDSATRPPSRCRRRVPRIRRRARRGRRGRPRRDPPRRAADPRAPDRTRSTRRARPRVAGGLCRER